MRGSVTVSILATSLHLPHQLFAETDVRHVISLLFHSARIALNFDSATSEDATAAQKSAREYCLSSARDVTAILRKYRSQYGLRYAPFVLIYGLVQAARCLAVFGALEESSYMTRALDECSMTWKLGQQMRGPVL